MNESPAARLQATLNLNPAEELRQLLDFTPELIAVLGPNRERLYANRLALGYLGASLEEWRGGGPPRRDPPPDLPRPPTDPVHSRSHAGPPELCTRGQQR